MSPLRSIGPTCTVHACLRPVRRFGQLCAAHYAGLSVAQRAVLECQAQQTEPLDSLERLYRLPAVDPPDIAA